MRFGSRGPRKFLRPSPCRSSRIRHRNALTKRAWKDAVQGLGNRSPLWVDSYLKRRGRCGQSQSRTSSLRPLLRMLAWRDRWSRGTKTLGMRVGQSRNMRDTQNSGPSFMEKSWPRKEGHPPRRVNYIYSKRLYEKKVDPAFPRADNSAHACSDCLASTIQVDPAGWASQSPKCLYGLSWLGWKCDPTIEKGDPTAWLVSLLYSSQLFVSRVKGSPSLVRKGKDKFSSCKRGITDSNNLIDG